MSTKRAQVAFSGTQEQKAALDKVIESHRDVPGALMPVLQQAQDIYGYLPLEVQREVSLGLEIPLEEVYGVVTFYSQFSLFPKGKYRVSVCLGTACYVKGAGPIFDKFKSELGIEDGECTEDGEFSLEACRCIGACGLAPVLTVNEDVYGRLTESDVEGILKKYRS